MKISKSVLLVVSILLGLSASSFAEGPVTLSTQVSQGAYRFPAIGFAEYLRYKLNATDIELKAMGKRIVDYNPMNAFLNRDLTFMYADIAFHKDGKLYTAKVIFDHWNDRKISVEWPNARYYLQNNKGKWKKVDLITPEKGSWDYDWGMYSQSPKSSKGEVFTDARKKLDPTGSSVPNQESNQVSSGAGTL